MNDFPEHMRGFQREVAADNRSLDSDRDGIFAADENPNQIVTFAPKERFRLGYFDVMCLVMNRMIGETTTLVPEAASLGLLCGRFKLLFPFHLE